MKHLYNEAEQRAACEAAFPISEVCAGQWDEDRGEYWDEGGMRDPGESSYYNFIYKVWKTAVMSTLAPMPRELAIARYEEELDPAPQDTQWS